MLKIDHKNPLVSVNVAASVFVHLGTLPILTKPVDFIVQLDLPCRVRRTWHGRSTTGGFNVNHM